MRRLLTTSTFVLAFLGLLAPAALAGSAHFVQSAFTISRSGDSLVVSGKEAGLGDEPQIHVVLSATAQCVNGGGNKPSAGNKQSVNTAADVPVQNGQATYTLSLTAVFQPDCSPPMQVAYSNVVLTDTTSGLSYTFPGTY